MDLSSCIDLLFIILLYFSTIAIYVNSHGRPALTFIQKNHALLNIKGKIYLGETSLNHSIAVACPAENNEETEFNKKSLGGHSLFVKATYNVPSDGTPLYLKDVIYERCQNSFKMSICFQKSPAEFLFGYEVYYDREIEGIKSNKYDNFDYVENAYKWGISLTKRSKPTLKLKDTPLNFVWILSFRVIFDYPRSRPRQIIYTVSKTTKIGVSCKHNRLGQKFYTKNKNISLASLYENQRKTFEDVEVPKYIDEPKKKACKSEDQCLTRESLIPAEEFRFRDPEPKKVGCSDLTTVPIWESIAQDALRKIDRFLYALAKVVDRDLHLAAGVHDTLQLPRLGQPQKLKKIKSVPRVIYKMVKYHVPVLDETSKPKNSSENLPENATEKPTHILETRALIILIHNDPNFLMSNAVCGKENCKNWGWEEILYRGIPSIKENPSNYVFCCRADEKTLKYLNMKIDDYKELNLNGIPVFDKESKKTTIEDIKQRVIHVMNKLLFKNENDFDDDQDDEDVWNYDSNKDTDDTEDPNDDFDHLDDTDLPKDDFNDGIDDEKHSKDDSSNNVDESQVYYSSENDEQKAETTQQASNLLSRSTTSVSSGNESDGDTSGSEKENKGDTTESKNKNGER